MSVLNEPVYHRAGPPVVGRVIGHPEMVKDDLHPFEGLVEVGMIFFREGPRRYTVFLGTHHDRGSVVVGTADKHHRLAPPPQVTNIEICRHIGPKVPEMAGAVGIGKAAGHEDGSVVHHYLF